MQGVPQRRTRIPLGDRRVGRGFVPADQSSLRIVPLNPPTARGPRVSPTTGTKRNGAAETHTRHSILPPRLEAALVANVFQPLHQTTAT